MTYLFFFFNDTATTEIYTLSLHDALPISPLWRGRLCRVRARDPATAAGSRIEAGGPGPDRRAGQGRAAGSRHGRDRKSTRLNSSHLVISYAVFCLKKKNHEFTS